MKRKKDNRGGRREGAGRPVTEEPTKVMRVPESLVPKVETLIAKHKKKKL